MGFDENIRLIEEYNEWVAERKRSANDLTPEAFMVDRAKEDALSKLIQIDGLLDKEMPIYDKLTAIERIIRGDGDSEPVRI